MNNIKSNHPLEENIPTTNIETDDKQIINKLNEEFMTYEKDLVQQLKQYQNRQANNAVMHNPIKSDHRLEKILDNLADPVKTWIAKQNTQTKQGQMIINLATNIRNLQETREKELLSQVIALLIQDEKEITFLKNEVKKLEIKLKPYQDDENDNDIVITNDEQVPKFISEVLDKAIPHSARIKNCKNGKYVINKNNEISDLIPSNLLLNYKEKDGLILKIMQEVLMTNFWNGNAANYGLYSAWAMNTLDYSIKGNWGANYRLFPKSIIKGHNNDSIIYTRMLFNSEKQLYFDEIFNMIEQYLQKHGVNCNVIKAFNPSYGRLWYTKKVFVSHGSLSFPKVKIKGISSNAPYYYLQINFDIKMKSNNKIYQIRGYTLLLTSALNLYVIR